MMKPVKCCLLFVNLIFFSFFLKAQTHKSTASQFTGTWTIVSHSSVTKDTTMELQFQEYARFYSFKSDGTYTLKYFGKGSAFESNGKWKYSQDFLKISLYDIKMNYAAPPNTSTKNQSLHILKFSDSSFTMKEYLSDDIKPGLSIYKTLK